jgi:hypothetical protein
MDAPSKEYVAMQHGGFKGLAGLVAVGLIAVGLLVVCLVPALATDCRRRHRRAARLAQACDEPDIARDAARPAKFSKCCSDAAREVHAQAGGQRRCGASDCLSGHKPSTIKASGQTRNGSTARAHLCICGHPCLSVLNFFRRPDRTPPADQQQEIQHR